MMPSPLVHFIDNNLDLSGKPLGYPLRRFVAVLFLALLIPRSGHAEEPAAAPASPLRIATFDVDATPPLDFMMAYDRVKRVDPLGLRCRGIVLLGSGDPIVLCAIDWLGVANEAQDIFRATLATAAGTSKDRVAVHALHQHDAPHCDFSAERILNELGASELGAFEGSFARELLLRLKPAVAAAVAQATPITHAGFATADVQQVASNRRILGEDGKVRAVRYTTCKDPLLRAEPEGVIDPQLSSLSFWNESQPVAVLSYYATHPQSYYRTGVPSPDFPGIARFLRSQDVPDVLHLHFTGAGGNIGAGKYNDGDTENRLTLAERVADAMERAFESTSKFPIQPEDIDWSVAAVTLSPAEHLDADALRETLTTQATAGSWTTAAKLAWLQRCQSGQQIDLGCLRVGDVRVLHMPGELFVEYQLAAKAMRPDLQVAMAAYGDYGPAYIGTAKAYEEGGYETSERATNVGPEAEQVLLEGIGKLLEVSK